MFLANSEVTVDNVDDGMEFKGTQVHINIYLYCLYMYMYACTIYMYMYMFLNER